MPSSVRTILVRICPAKAPTLAARDTCKWIGTDRQVRALIAEMREVAAKAQQLMLEETQSKAG